MQNTLGGARGDSKNPQGILHPRSKYTRVFGMGVPKTRGVWQRSAAVCMCACACANMLRQLPTVEVCFSLCSLRPVSGPTLTLFSNIVCLGEESGEERLDWGAPPTHRLRHVVSRGRRSRLCRAGGGARAQAPPQRPPPQHRAACQPRRVAQNTPGEGGAGDG